MAEFTLRHEQLLLTVARTLRGQLKDIPHPGRDDREDLHALNEVLEPFDPAPAEPVNEAATTDV